MAKENEVLLLDETRKLFKDGYNPAILALIEQKHLENALRCAKSMGLKSEAPEILRMANESLPKGDHLSREYVQVRLTANSADIRDLQEVSDRLTLAAQRLETVAARSIAAGVPANVAQRAAQEHQIGQRYAEVILAAKTLEGAGMISSHRNAQLEKLTEKPSGPLAPYYDKACALVNAHEQAQEHTHARMRM